MGGPIGHVFPLWQRHEIQNNQIKTNYKVIENFGKSDAIVPVAAVIKGVKEGNTSCEMNIWNPDTAQNMVETTLDVSVVPLVDQVSNGMFSIHFI